MGYFSKCLPTESKHIKNNREIESRESLTHLFVLDSYTNTTLSVEAVH